MSSVLGTVKEHREPLSSLLMLVLCHSCGNAAIFDTTPVVLQPLKEAPLQSQNFAAPRINGLKQTLERSLPPASSSSLGKDIDLESFLTGFL